MKVQVLLKQVTQWLKQWLGITKQAMTASPEKPSRPKAPPSEPRPNSNFNTRPGSIDMIIIHAVGLKVLDDNGKTWDGDEWIAYLGLSYHGLVRPDGKVIVTVPRIKRAWHAGRSAWKGESNLNDNSIGFAAMVDHDPLGYGNFLKAMGDPDTYTNDHYASLAFLCWQAMKDFPQITANRILRHSDVSGSSVRQDPKRDPGDGFDMDRLKHHIRTLTDG